MIASLPWYPAGRPVFDRLWGLTQAALGLGSASLTWPEDLMAHWRRDPILLTQTCAPIWQRHLRDHLHVVGAFDFGVASPGFYCSAVVTRLSEDRALDVTARRAAVNDFDSQSGWGALTPLAPQEVILTGSHAASMQAVADGAADLAAIDTVTWRLTPHSRLKVRTWTSPTPAPPLLTADAALIAPLQAALTAAISQLSASDRRFSGLRGFVPLDAASYAELPLPPQAPRCIRRGIAA